MDAEIIPISDEDEEITESVRVKTPSKRPALYHYNEYDWSYVNVKKDDNVTIPHSDVLVMLDDDEIEQILIHPIQRISRQILLSTLSAPTTFPYQLLVDLEQHLNTNLQLVPQDVEAKVWNNMLEHLASIKMAYEHMDLKADLKYNFLIIKILSQYVNFCARQVATMRSLSREKIMELCSPVWHQINSLLSGDVNFIILLLLRSDIKKDLRLCKLLYPLFNKAHFFIFCGKHKKLPMPEILVFIITVLFYKHWKTMLTTIKDKMDHYRIWRICIRKHFLHMPKPANMIYNDFIRRVDDQFVNALLYGKTALDLLKAKFDTTKAIRNFFREYETFVFRSDVCGASTKLENQYRRRQPNQQHLTQKDLQPDISEVTRYFADSHSNNSSSKSCSDFLSYNSFSNKLSKTTTSTTTKLSTKYTTESSNKNKEYDDDDDDLIIIEPDTPVIAIDDTDDIVKLVAELPNMVVGHDSDKKSQSMTNCSLTCTNFNYSKHNSNDLPVYNLINAIQYPKQQAKVIPFVDNTIGVEQVKLANEENKIYCGKTVNENVNLPLSSFLSKKTNSRTIEQNLKQSIVPNETLLAKESYRSTDVHMKTTTASEASVEDVLQQVCVELNQRKKLSTVSSPILVIDDDCETSIDSSFCTLNSTEKSKNCNFKLPLQPSTAYNKKKSNVTEKTEATNADTKLDNSSRCSSPNFISTFSTPVAVETIKLSDVIDTNAVAKVSTKPFINFNQQVPANDSLKEIYFFRNSPPVQNQSRLRSTIAGRTPHDQSRESKAVSEHAIFTSADDIISQIEFPLNYGDALSTLLIEIKSCENAMHFTDQARQFSFIDSDLNKNDDMLIRAFDTEELRISLYDDEGNSIPDLTDAKSETLSEMIMQTKTATSEGVINNSFSLSDSSSLERTVFDLYGNTFNIWSTSSGTCAPMKVILDPAPMHKKKYKGKSFNENIDDNDVASAFAGLSFSICNDIGTNNIISGMSDVHRTDIDDDIYMYSNYLGYNMFIDNKTLNSKTQYNNADVQAFLNESLITGKQVLVCDPSELVDFNVEDMIEYSPEEEQTSTQQMEQDSNRNMHLNQFSLEPEHLTSNDFAFKEPKPVSVKQSRSPAAKSFVSTSKPNQITRKSENILIRKRTLSLNIRDIPPKKVRRSSYKANTVN